MKQKQLLKPLFLLCALLVGGLNSLWAQDVSTYQHVFNAKPSTGNNVTLSSVNWDITATNLGAYNSGNYAGVQIGTKNNDGSITLTSSSDWNYNNKTVITEVRLWLNLGGTSVTPTVTIGGESAISDGTTVVKNSSAGSDYTKATKVTFTPASNGNTGVIVINVATVKAGYICAMEIDCKEAGSASDTRTATTTTIDDAGITNTNVFDGTAAGSLSASVVAGGTSITGATVTWSGNNDKVAKINESTGVVTLVAAGTVTFTATYAGNDNYKPSSATYEMTVTNNDPNANDGSEEKPFTVAEAIAYINTLGSATSPNEIYVSGIVSQVDSYNSNYNSITYWISDDGKTTTQMEVYSGKGLNGADFSSKDDLAVGDIVTVKGYVKKYGSTPEFDKNNILVKFEHPTTPIITASDVELTYDATSGEIAYSINNPETGTSLTATTTETWISDITVGTDKITFTTSANTGDERTGTITLTYGTLTKDVTVTQAKYVAPAEEYTWVKTELANLSATDVFVIVGDNGSTYAMSNDNGTGSAPVATAVNITGNIWTGAIADNLLWNVSGNATDGYTFYPNGTTETWLYCINQNNGVRVGTNAGNKTFTLDGDYLKNTATSRYVGIYNSQDWRCYTSSTAENIKDQTFSFYKKADASVTISDAGYKAYNTVIDTDFSGTGVTAYVVTGHTTESVTLETVTTAPAGTPLVLKGDEGTHALNKAENAAKPAKNLLLVSNGTVGNGTTIYALANVDGPGFYVVKSGLTIPTNYIKIENSTGNAPALSFDFGEGTTGIRSIENGQLTIDNVYYDLSGRKLNAMPTQKGVYIVNGKKVVIK